MLIECEATSHATTWGNGFDLRITRVYIYRLAVEADDLHQAADRFAWQAYGIHPERIGGVPIQAYCLACRCPLTGPSLQHACRKMAGVRWARPLVVSGR